MAEKSCPVPECEDGYVRVPEIYEEKHYGVSEKFVRFIEVQCGECHLMGRV
jgi:hypothetical protein